MSIAWAHVRCIMSSTSLQCYPLAFGTTQMSHSYKSIVVPVGFEPTTPWWLT